MSIFVSISSFCDEDLKLTIDSLYKTASNKVEITLGVFDQSFESIEPWLKEQPYYANIKYLHINPIHSKGCSWARSVVSNLYDDELYHLQIDSHTWFFFQDWDILLISLHRELAKFSPKPIISHYPVDFQLNDDQEPYLVKENKPILHILKPKKETLAEGDIATPFIYKTIENHHFAKGFHLAGGFIFTYGRFIREVPYDPFLYFHGDEQSIAIRAYTRGWDIYHPNLSLIPLAHRYKTAGQIYDSQHWRRDIETVRKVKWHQRQKVAYSRLVDMIIDQKTEHPFSLGTVRSLDDFIQFSGMDYLNYQYSERKTQFMDLPYSLNVFDVVKPYRKH